MAHIEAYAKSCATFCIRNRASANQARGYATYVSLRHPMTPRALAQIGPGALCNAHYIFRKGLCSLARATISPAALEPVRDSRTPNWLSFTKMTRFRQKARSHASRRRARNRARRASRSSSRPISHAHQCDSGNNAESACRRKSAEARQRRYYAPHRSFARSECCAVCSQIPKKASRGRKCAFGVLAKLRSPLPTRRFRPGDRLH